MIYVQYNITYRKKDKGIQFIISYKDNSGKWKQKSKQGFKKHSLAKIAADKMLDELKNTGIDCINIEYIDITFKDFSNMFIEHSRLYKEENTIRGYKNALKRFRAINDLKLVEIKNRDIQSCIDDMVKDNLAPYTVVRYTVRIKAIFNNAIKQYNIINKLPFNDLQLPKEKCLKEKKALTISELKDLLSKIKNKKHYMIALLTSKCGLRIGEILGLTWVDIDQTSQIIKVNKQWKLLKDGSSNWGTLKSKNSEREVPIPKKLIDKLNEYKKLFPPKKDNRIFDYVALADTSRHLSESFKSAGYNISVHELRHTYATMIISNNIDFKTAAQLLGHDVLQTEKTYSHVNDDMIKKATRIINTILDF